MLKCTEVAIQANSMLTDLEARLWIISSFLGPLRNMTLSEACSMGSITLLDWIWVSSCTRVTDRVPQWTLCNFLRSDPHYYRFQFARSLNGAATRGDFAVVEWLLDHFSDCEAPTLVFEVAAKSGHLQILKLLLSHSYGVGEVEEKRLETRKTSTSWDGQQNFTAGEDTATDACWRAILQAAENGHGSIVRWLWANVPYDKSDDRYGRAIGYALRCGDDDLVTYLLPRGRCVLDYAEKCPRVDVIEWMFQCGYLSRSAELAGCAICDLAGSDRLDLMQQIAHQHPTFLQKWSSYWLPGYWYGAIRSACTNGKLLSVRWLMEHPRGIEVRKRIQEGFYRENLISLATEEGHCEVTKYLCEQSVRDDYDKALYGAISGNHLICVKVMLEQYLRAKRQAAHSVIDYAARLGYLEIVQYLHHFTIQDAQRMAHQELVCDAWWSRSDESVCAAAAGSGNLELVQWAYHSRPREGVGSAMDRAAGEGHLEVLKWLDANTEGRCTQRAIHDAVSRGHLAVVQWLYANFTAIYGEESLSVAVVYGHFDVAKCVFVNLPEKCTLYAFSCALHEGPLRLAYWLREHFPDLDPPNQKIRLHTFSPTLFEMMLFRQVHYPHMMTNENLQAPVSVISKCWPHDERTHALGWIKENFRNFNMSY